MATTEPAYMELMKNCSKWNSRLFGERKFRVPVFDHQTVRTHRPSATYFRRAEQRLPLTDDSQGIRYPSERWRKRASAPPADAIEMKHFMHSNPALADALNATQATPAGPVDPATAENSMDAPVESMMSQPSRRSTAKITFDDYEHGDDFDSDEGGAGSDDGDDWGRSRKKGKKTDTPKNRGGKKSKTATPARAPPLPRASAASSASAQGGAARAASAASRRSDTSPERPPQPCDQCPAKYKSRQGLSYHRAYVHGIHPPAGEPVRCVSPSVDVSTHCDLCLGSRHENKTTKRPEDMVSCHDCGRSAHPSCLKFSPNVLVISSRFGWQCIECKSCAICGTSDNDDQLLFCDDCDRGFHLYCMRPPMQKAPEGDWNCQMCVQQFGRKAQ